MCSWDELDNNGVVLIDNLENRSFDSNKSIIQYAKRFIVIFIFVIKIYIFMDWGEYIELENKYSTAMF